MLLAILSFPLTFPNAVEWDSRNQCCFRWARAVKTGGSRLHRTFLVLCEKPEALRASPWRFDG